MVNYGDTYNAGIDHGIVGGRRNTNTVNHVVNNITEDKVIPGEKGFEILLTRVAPNAQHNSGEVSAQPNCHPGTREAILEFLFSWACLLTSLHSIQWLHGPAGAGKSTILRTIAQKLFENGLLLGSFFFFRTSPGRNTSDFVIATIAFQLALAIPEARQHIGEAIERNPLVFSLSLRHQALALVISPLVSIFYNPNVSRHKCPRVIIIDGLDECQNPDRQCDLLDVLRYIVQSVPMSIAVLIASRPEHHIRDAFTTTDLNKCSSRLALDDSYQQDKDIKKYLVHMFNRIRQNHRTEFASITTWPAPEAIDTLVTKASGQFIYASTVDKFVSSKRGNPVRRLDIILGAVHAGNQRPFEQLDGLYSTIFQTIGEANIASTLLVLGLLLIPLDLPKHENYENHSPAYLEYFLELGDGDVRDALFDLESLLTIRGKAENIQFFHASLSDYLFDKSRSGQFWIDPGLIFASIAQHSISNLLRWKEVGAFLWKYNELLSSNAGSTPELKQAIQSSDFEKVITTFPEHDVHGIKDICPLVLQIGTDDSRFPDGPEVFRRNVLYFRQIILERLPVYFESIHLKCFLVAVTFAKKPQDGYERFMDDLAGFFLSPSDRQLENTLGFDLCHSLRTPLLMQFIEPFLDDTKGKYFIDEVEYTNMTLFFLRHMFRIRGKWDPVYDSLRERLLVDLYPHFSTRSLIRSDLIEETNELLGILDCSGRFGWSLEFSNTLEAYISRAQGTSSRDQISQETRVEYGTKLKQTSGLGLGALLTGLVLSLIWTGTTTWK